MNIVMPVHKGKDSQGTYYQWGNHGKKYYCGSNDKSCQDAKAKATKQGIAAHANGYYGK